MSKPNSVRPRRNVSSKKSNSSDNTPTLHIQLDADGQMGGVISNMPIFVFLGSTLMLVDRDGTRFIQPTLAAPAGITRRSNVVDISSYRRHADDAALTDA